MITEFLNNLNFKELIVTDEAQRALLYFLSYLCLLLYFISLLIIIFYIKEFNIIKTNPFSFFLLNSITNLFELTIIYKNLFSIKNIIIFISYLFQIHLVISSFNILLSGKNIFKSEKNYSIKNIIYIEILLSLISFPYDKFFNIKEMIVFFQYLIIIILIVLFSKFVENKINQVIQLLNENNNKVIIEIGYMESMQLNRIYTLMKNLWFINFIFISLIYVFKYIDIILKKYAIFHFFLTFILISLEETAALLNFILLTIIILLLNNYNIWGLLKVDEEENNISNEEKIKIKNEDEENRKENKIEESEILKNEYGNINIKINRKKEEYHPIGKSKNEDNIIEIENLYIANGKEYNNNEEEEKLDYIS